MSRMKLEIANLQRSLSLDVKEVRRVVRRVQRQEGQDLALSLVFVDDRRIRELNRRFLGRNTVTDVLAFPGEPVAEVIVNAEKAVSEAQKRGLKPSAELMLYVIHGVLHLLGYDDQSASAVKLMRKREAELLEALGYGRVPV